MSGYGYYNRHFNPLIPVALDKGKLVFSEDIDENARLSHDLNKKKMLLPISESFKKEGPEFLLGSSYIYL